MDNQLRQIISTLPKDKDIVHIILPSQAKNKRKSTLRGQRSCN